MSATVIDSPSAWRQLIFADLYAPRSSACANAAPAKLEPTSPAAPIAAPCRRISRRPGLRGPRPPKERSLIEVSPLSVGRAGEPGARRGGRTGRLRASARRSSRRVFDYITLPASCARGKARHIRPAGATRLDTLVQSKSSRVPRLAAGTRRNPVRRRDAGVTRPGARPSAKDVARLAGVSTATVSRAINLPDRVDAKTRASVDDAVAKLGYVPHGAARALRSRRSQMVGAVVPSVDYALYARTTSALQAVLDAKGYSLVLAEQHYDLDAEVRVTEQLIGHGVDAFVFVGLHHDPRLFALLDAYGRPYVLTWGVDPMRRHPSIGFDNRAALAQAGLALDERHARYGAIDLASSRAMMHELLALRDPPTAVVSTNDV